MKELIDKYLIQAEARSPLVFSSGHGCRITDSDGQDYLDLTSGQVCAIVGHNHPKINEVINKQSDKLIHTHSGFFSEEEVLLAKTIADATKNDLCRSFFLCTGGEAVELAMRLAKMVTQKYEFVSLERSWHGLSNACSALTGIKTYAANAGPFSPGFIHIPAPDCYRCILGKSRDECKSECLEVAERIIEASSCNQLAAIILEPVLAGGGILEPPKSFFLKIKEVCEANDALLIFDESQTGIGRTGTMFAYEWSGVIPDIMILAKGLGAGLPISAVVTNDRISGVAKERGFKYLTSHMGDPLPCRVARETFRIIKEENLIENAKTMGEYFVDCLVKLQSKHDVIGDVRGSGLMIGIEIVKDKESKEPGFEEGRILAKTALERGIIMNLVQPHNIIRIVPPLIIKKEDIDYAISVIDEILSSKHLFDNHSQLNQKDLSNSFA
ncbi:MAG: aspartate aminotransferase family protein [Bacteroidetes bacterium]|nr:aspartate aminotransferase family protein [Bacteroidota bacterium]